MQVENYSNIRPLHGQQSYSLLCGQLSDQWVVIIFWRHQDIIMYTKALISKLGGGWQKYVTVADTLSIGPTPTAPERVETQPQSWSPRALCLPFQFIHYTSRSSEYSWVVSVVFIYGPETIARLVCSTGCCGRPSRWCQDGCQSLLWQWQHQRTDTVPTVTYYVTWACFRAQSGTGLSGWPSTLPQLQIGGLFICQSIGANRKSPVLTGLEIRLRNA